jgi:UDP-4-amino-4,6-dideoxy-L-N-acetyl-beta-L-altrosamine transaminase
MKIIPYGKQFINDSDKKLVLNSLSNDLITTGPYVKKFEYALSQYLKCKYSYACSSGTAAIHLAMMSINLKKDDIILMPAINFIASYNMAKTMQLKVCLVDVDEHTGQITPQKVIECIKKNKLKKIKALITMYHGGYPDYSKKFYELKKKYKFFIIEDACHALGSEYKYKNRSFKIGSCKHSDVCTFSLHPLKTITSGEGGIVTTNNNKIAKNICLLRSHGISRSKKEYWKYDVLKHGFNYRLSDINCALGLSQLKKINFFLKKRKKIYEKYLIELENFNSKLIIPKYSKNIKPSFHLFIVNIIFEKLKTNKDHFMNYLIDKNIMAQQHYIPIYRFSVYTTKKINFCGADKFFKSSVSLPIFVNLDDKHQKKIIRIIKKYFKKISI